MSTASDKQLFESLDLNNDDVINVYELALGMAILDPATCLPRPRTLPSPSVEKLLTARNKVELLFVVFDASEQSHISGVQFFYLARCGANA